MNLRTGLIALSVVCALVFLTVTVLDYTRTGRLDLKGVFGIVLSVGVGVSASRRFPRPPTP